MKILHVIDSDGIYGAEIVLLNLMEEHQRMSQSTLLLSLDSSDLSCENSLAEEAMARGLSVSRFCSGRGYSLGSALWMLRFAKEQEIDIIHSHGYKGNILLGSIPKFIRKTPAISTVHGWTATKFISKIWLYTIFDKLCLRNMDAVIYVNSVCPRIGKGEYFVVENGIPLLDLKRSDGNGDDDPITNFCKEGFIVGSVSRLSEEKGLVHLIEAMAMLVKKGIKVKAVIIGEGPQRKRLEELIHSEKLSENILIAGYRDKAYKYLSLFDAFVLPSLTEGLPVTILEAMQAGVPIIASRVGGIPDVLMQGELGILTEPGNHESIAEAIIRLYENPDGIQRMEENARDVACTRYSSQRMAEEYIKVYEAVLKKWKQ